MKKLILTCLIIFGSLFLINTHTTHAHMDSMVGADNNENTAVSENDHTESVEKVLQEMLSKQKVSTIQELNLSKISNDDWEHLGDAVMELEHPGEAHEVMDRMMGGEGSKLLRQMHINMGKAYLGYGGNYGPGMMMGRGMIGYNNNINSYQKGGGDDHMMGNFGSSPMGIYGGIFGLIVMLLFWILIISGLAVIIKWVINQGKVSNNKKSPIDIIKERYAKGEIDKKEFDKLKKDLE